MILPAQTIRAKSGLISPFMERYRFEGLTGGLSPAGYDCHVAETFILWPKQFRLASTIERFVVPDDLTFKVEDKSTWARRGLSLFNTTAEPGWEGYLTLELVNHSWRPLRMQRGMPIAQIVFHRLETATEQPYRGRYQYQAPGPQKARPATCAKIAQVHPEKIERDLAAMGVAHGVVMIPDGWRANDYADFLTAEKAKREAGVEAITAGAGR